MAPVPAGGDDAVPKRIHPEKPSPVHHSDKGPLGPEHLFREMSDNLDEVLWSFDWIEQRVLYVSPAYEKIWGRPAVDLYANYEEWEQGIHPDDRLIARERFDGIIKTGGGVPSQYRIIKPDGQVRWVSDCGFAVTDDTGKVVRITGIAKDITKRVAAEASLRVSEANYHQLFNMGPDAVIITDMQTRQIVDANRRVLELYGYKRHDIIGSDAVKLSAEPERSSKHIQVVSQNIAECRPTDPEERLHCKKDGTIFPVEITSGPFSRGDRVMICVIIRDISTRKKKEYALRKLQAQQEAILNNIPDIAWLKDHESRFIAVNRAFGMACGVNPADLVGKTDLDAWPKNLAESYMADDSRVVETGEQKTVEEPLVGADGQRKWIETIKTPIRDDSSAIVGTTGIARDITKRKLTENLLQAEKERLSVTLRSIGDGVITTDRAGRVTLINQIANELTGWNESEAIGRPLEQVFRIVDEHSRQPCANPVQQVIAHGKIVGLANDTVLISKDGREFVIADSGAPISDSHGHIAGVVLVFRDITQSRKMETELLRMEKLESLGVLAGGIAHDFNNFLTGIIGNLSLALLDCKVSDPVYTRLKEMEKAAMRAKNLTQQLLTFSKGGQPVRSETDLSHLVREAAQFATRGTNVRCRFSFEKGTLFGIVDEGQMIQVIHNIILNAVQAMPEGGAIHIDAENLDVKPNNRISLDPGHYVKLSISDNGTGIKKEHLKKMFDPYFTTKQKGSGLGLAMTHSIIDKHDGRITAASELGVGTTIAIFLPAIRRMECREPEKKSTFKTGSGRIMVMDDEDYIRNLVSQILMKMGFEVTVVKDGDEAVRRYQRALDSGRAFDAVILDLTVPGAMGGKEAIQKLLEIDSGVKAIVSSGYSNDPVMSNFAEYGFQQAVSKPYRIEELCHALDQIFDEAFDE